MLRHGDVEAVGLLVKTCQWVNIMQPIGQATLCKVYLRNIVPLFSANDVEFMALLTPPQCCIYTERRLAVGELTYKLRAG